MSIKDLFNVKKIKQENEKLKSCVQELTLENQEQKKFILEYNLKIEELKAFIDELGAGEALVLKDKITSLVAEYQNKTIEHNELINQLELLSNEVKVKKELLLVLDEDLLLESFALYKPKFSFQTSLAYKEKLDDIRASQKAMIKNGSAATGNQNWTVNNSVQQGKKMVNDMIKLLIRSFNNECDSCVDNVKFNNIELNEKRINQAYETLNKLGTIMQCTIAEKFKFLKLQELHLAYEYQVKKQEEKEAQKKARAELKEQQKLEQEIRQAREKIAKDRKHFTNAIKDQEAKQKLAQNDEEKALIATRLLELQAQLAELEKEEKVIDYREQNAKAGYVYVISNIGAFGEGVYKIGMTRRLEPMDRVDELGDASVPFSFDVHALIFSDNAPALETELHNHFFKNRINKINNKKEFFRADINEIERVIRENYDKIVDVIKEAPAEQYREGLHIKD